MIPPNARAELPTIPPSSSLRYTTRCYPSCYDSAQQHVEGIRSKPESTSSVASIASPPPHIHYPNDVNSKMVLGACHFGPNVSPVKHDDGELN